MSINSETPQNDQPVNRFRRILAEQGSDEPDVESNEVGEGIGNELTDSLEQTGTLFGEPYEDTPSPLIKEETVGAQDIPETRPYPQQSIADDLLAPPLMGRTPPASHPALGTQGLPLPRRVSEIDQDATRITPQYPPSRPTRAIPRQNITPNPSRTLPRSSRSGQPAQPRPVTPPRQASQPPAEESFDFKMALGCLARTIIIGIFSVIIIAFCGFSFLLLQYFQIAQDLPNIEDLRQRASQFETTRILDRDGNVLYEILDPNAGRRTYIPLEKISPYLVAATIATEDKEFYNHPGFDVTAIFRAFLQNFQSGETVSGASTITQQLARNLLFTPEERSDKSYTRKIREAILASEITRRYSKDEILELYLNENYYGNLAYGVEAASETYFNITADKLSIGQAAFLAGLTQAPSIYDVYTNRDATLQRTSDVLVIMYNASQEQGCIYVSNSPQRVCIDPINATAAKNEIEAYAFPSPNIPIRYPHWVNYIRTQLEARFDPQTIYRSGFTVQTTLDPDLQAIGEKLVKEQVSLLADRQVSNGALIAIHPSSGEILAMVGSADFNNETIDGQVNMAISPRQPGSAIKPLTYLAAFEKGWTPATLIWDVPSEFSASGDPNDFGPTYKPVNYDERFHGPVTVRTALANSYNVPAVKALENVGIYDNPATPSQDGLIALAKRLGITTLTRPDYGLSLTLGGGDVTLLELTGAYAAIANAGRLTPLISITKILDHEGHIIYEPATSSAQQVLRPEHTFLISSILSDNEARSQQFGSNSLLNLPFPVAAKTGTTNDFRDNWTIGYTPDLAVGVWVGNADYSPMNDVSGITGAAPIWSDYMKQVVPILTGGRITQFARPEGVIDRVICAISGTEPSEWCPKQRTEIFAYDQPPLPKDQDLWQKAEIDTWTGLRSSGACSGFSEEKFVLNVVEKSAVKWIKNDADGKAWAGDMGFKKNLTFAPSRECKADDPRPKLAFNNLKEGDTLNISPQDVYALADATKNFDFFQLEFGLGADPAKWEILLKNQSPFTSNDKMYAWDVSALPSGTVTLKLYLHSTDDTYAELKVRLTIQVPTSTPTPTPTPTSSSTLPPPATSTGTPTLVNTATETPTATETVTETPAPP